MLGEVDVEKNYQRKAQQNVRRLWPTLYVEEKVAEILGASALLQRQVSAQ